MLEELAAIADLRGSQFVPVLLSCETPELVRRIVGESRKERMKLIDPVQGAYLNDTVPPFTTDDRRAIRLDVTALPPEAAAREIINHAIATG
jgi:hypothetical protein